MADFCLDSRSARGVSSIVGTLDVLVFTTIFVGVSLIVIVSVPNISFVDETRGVTVRVSVAVLVKNEKGEVSVVVGDTVAVCDTVADIVICGVRVVFVDEVVASVFVLVGVLVSVGVVKTPFDTGPKNSETVFKSMASNL